MLKNAFVSILVFLVSSILFTGCSPKSENRYHVTTEEDTAYDNNLIFLIANNQGSKLPDYNHFYNRIYSTLSEGGNIILIQMDNSPELIDTVSIDPKTLRGLSKANKNAQYELYTTATVQAMNTSLPDTIGVDTVRSFQEAANNMLDDQEYTIICCSNLISTEDSIVDMSAGVDSLCDQTESILSALSASENIPDLSGCRVELYQTGLITTQEKGLNNKEKQQLIDFYTSFLNECGVDNIQFVKATLPKNDTLQIPVELSYFPNIPVICEEISVINELTDESESGTQQQVPLTKETVYKFDEAKLEFKPDSSEFKDREKAIDLLKSFVTPINEAYGSGQEVVVIGTTANTTNGGSGDKKLSQSRASVVSNLLIELGVDKQAVKAYGMGYHPSICISNFDGNGNFVEEKGAKNRAVYIMLRSNPLAEKVLKD